MAGPGKRGREEMSDDDKTNKPIMFRVKKEYKAEIEELAATTGRKSVSDLLRASLTLYKKQHEDKVVSINLRGVPVDLTRAEAKDLLLDLLGKVLE